jgi:hypothetical protein
MGRIDASVTNLGGPTHRPRRAITSPWEGPCIALGGSLHHPQRIIALPLVGHPIALGGSLHCPKMLD